MRTTTVKLEDGLKLGDAKLGYVTVTELVLREPMAADYLDALEQSERAVLAPTGEFDEHGNPHLVPTLLVSAPLLDIHTMRRQITQFGDIPADPLPIEQLRQLSDADLELIRVAAELLAQRAPVEVVQRGRPDTAGDRDPQADGDTDIASDDDLNRTTTHDHQRNGAMGERDS